MCAALQQGLHLSHACASHVHVIWSSSIAFLAPDLLVLLFPTSCGQLSWICTRYCVFHVKTLLHLVAKRAESAGQEKGRMSGLWFMSILPT
jgi:hypothetical protein